MEHDQRRPIKLGLRILDAICNISLQAMTGSSEVVLYAKNTAAIHVRIQNPRKRILQETDLVGSLGAF